MKLRVEYTFHASHWNEDFEISKVSKLGALDLLKNQHGHLWRILIELEGPLGKSGIIYDYNKLQALIRSLDFTFLPLHPLTLGYLARKEGVSQEDLFGMAVWRTCGNLEVLLAALVERVVEMSRDEEVKELRIVLWETGPNASRNVSSLSAESCVSL